MENQNALDLVSGQSFLHDEWTDTTTRASMAVTAELMGDPYGTVQAELRGALLANVSTPRHNQETSCYYLAKYSL